MTNRDKKIRELKADVDNARNELAESNSKHGPNSPEVAIARKKRAMRGRVLFDFLHEERRLRAVGLQPSFQSRLRSHVSGYPDRV